jgi:hypothetical protein
LSGTSGTDHTFTIDFAEPNITAIYLPDANIENNKILYTIEGKLSKYGENGYIDLKDKNL